MALQEIELPVLTHRLAGAMQRAIKRRTEVREYDPASDADMLDFIERECGTKIREVPKVKAIVLAILRDARDGTIGREAILGARGMGKTRLAAAIALTLWRFFGYDAQIAGGSLRQAQRCYEYMGEAFTASDSLMDWQRRRTMTETRGHDDATIQVSAASETSVRGPHPRGPSGGGLLTIDEVALVPDQIVTAALGQLGSADPSVCVQLSTMGERQTGYWHELVSDPKHKGYRLWTLDIFDVTVRCPYECHECPEPAFADDRYNELGGGRKDLVHKALCAGRAHDSNGHVKIDEVMRLYQELDLETFLREFMGKNVAVIGKVWDPVTLERARVEDVTLGLGDQHANRFQVLEKAIGLDWGWAGMSAAVYAVRVRNGVVVYRWEMWDHTQYRQIREHLLDMAYEEQIETILPDAAEPSANDEMRAESSRRSYELQDEEVEGADVLDVAVQPVVFSKWKQYAYGEGRRRLEAGELLLPRTFGGRPVLNYDRAMEMLAAHRRRVDGMPEKKDDHVSDALVCALLKWSKRWHSQATVG